MHPRRPGPRGRRAAAPRPRLDGRGSSRPISATQLVEALAGARRHDDASASRGAAAARRTSGSATSALLMTTSSGTSRARRRRRAPRGPRPAAPRGRRREPSTTCRIRSASATSSSVERNASTSWCGRWRTKPTVSVEGVDATVGGLGPADGRVERGEQRVLDEHAGAGEPVEQRGLAGVGVAGDGHRRAPRCAGAPGAWCRGRSSCRRSRGAAWPSWCGSGAGRSRSSSHRGRGCRCRRTAEPPAPPAWRDIDSPQPRSRGSMYCIWASETCALPSRLLRVLGEDVEDQRGAVDDLDLDDVLELAQLAGRQLAVADDGVGAGRDHDVAQLARPCPSRCRWPGRAGRGAGSARRAPREPAVSASAASSAREFSASCGRALGPDADEHDPLEAQLAVLDLGDVLQLGGQARDAAQRPGGPRGRSRRRRSQRAGRPRRRRSKWFVTRYGGHLPVINVGGVLGHPAS